jgi:hypothetical protein
MARLGECTQVIDMSDQRRILETDAQPWVPQAFPDPSHELAGSVIWLPGHLQLLGVSVELT